LVCWTSPPDPLSEPERVFKGVRHLVFAASVASAGSGWRSQARGEESAGCAG
jgi:hypothetical protein